MKSTNQFRRKAVWLAIMAPVLLFAPGFSLADESKAIEVDVAGVSNVPSLITAIKKAAGGLLPNSVKDAEFRAEIARVFVQNARAAAEKGYRIPKWVLEKLPHHRKVVFPFLGVATFAILGVLFTVPVSTIIIAVLASMVIMSVAVSAAIKAMVNKPRQV